MFLYAVAFFALLRKIRRKKKQRQRRKLSVVPTAPTNKNSSVYDPEALEAAEKQVSDQKTLLQSYAEQDYFVVRTLGSSEGFSSTYVYELLSKLKSEGLRAEIIESNGSLVGMETGNFLRYEVLAHVDDAEAVKIKLKQWFSKK